MFRQVVIRSLVVVGVSRLGSSWDIEVLLISSTCSSVSSLLTLFFTFYYILLLPNVDRTFIRKMTF